MKNKYGRKLTKNWDKTCPNCGRINVQDGKRPSDKCHRCGHERRSEEGGAK